MKLYNECSCETVDAETLKKISLQILRDFSAFCTEHGIRFCLTQGTLLGAVRHRGMIPWDDDIDIAVFRPDYDRLISLADKMPDTCRFVCRETDGDFPRLYGRACNMRYRVLDKYYSKKYIGYYGIDIFPIEAVPGEDAEFDKFAKKLKRLRRMFIFSNSALFLGTDFLRAYVVKPPLILFCKAVGTERIYKKFKSLATSIDYESASSLAIVTGEYAEHEKFSKEFYEDITLLDFEGMKLPATKYYAEYLRQLFGDYLTPPPESERKPHHSFYVFKDGKQQ